MFSLAVTAAAAVVVGVVAAVPTVRPFRVGQLSACARRVQQTPAVAVACGRSVYEQLTRCNGLMCARIMRRLCQPPEIYFPWTWSLKRDRPIRLRCGGAIRATYAACYLAGTVVPPSIVDGDTNIPSQKTRRGGLAFRFMFHDGGLRRRHRRYLGGASTPYTDTATGTLTVPCTTKILNNMVGQPCFVYLRFCWSEIILTVFVVFVFFLFSSRLRGPVSPSTSHHSVRVSPVRSTPLGKLKRPTDSASSATALVAAAAVAAGALSTEIRELKRPGNRAQLPAASWSWSRSTVFACHWPSKR